MNDIESVAEHKEKLMFVTTLAKYKLLLSSERSAELNKRKNEALTEFTNEFNKDCGQHLSRMQIIKRVRNLKSRLKEKNYRISVKKEKLVYLDWEKMFLDLWVGGDTSVLPNKIDKDYKKRREVNEVEDKDIEIKVETDDYMLQESSHISTEASNHIWDSESEPETQSSEREDSNHSKDVKQKKNDEIYEKNPLEDLKRATLIAQIKTLKAQEDAALADEKLQVYKLSVLKQQRGELLN